MRKLAISLILLAFVAIAGLNAQNHYLVELENRAPDVQALVQAYEGTQSIPFLANDVHGKEQAIFNMTGKTVLLWFWNMDCNKCKDQIADLNLLAGKYPKDLQIVSFSDNTKEEVLKFMETTTVEFPVIANSKTLSDGPYGGDLGYPKYFVLDKNGLIKWVIPEVEMKNNFDTFGFFETLHISLQKS